MNFPHKIAAAIFAVCLVSVVALAAEVSPEGNWKWTALGRSGPRDATAKFQIKEGKLTGFVTTSRGDLPVHEGTFKAGAIAFFTEVMLDKNKIVSKYAGHLDGDTIKGTIDRSGRDGGPPIRVDWNASRVK